MFRWVPTHGYNIPKDAIRGGYEADGKPLFVARAMFQGDWTPGKAGCHISGCHFPYGGKECIAKDYEVLVLDVYAPGFLEWKPGSGGNVPYPECAICLQSSHAYYIARAYYNGSLIPGRLHTSHECAYVSYGGQEIEVNDYEVLCQVK